MIGMLFQFGLVQAPYAIGAYGNPGMIQERIPFSWVLIRLGAFGCPRTEDSPV